MAKSGGNFSQEAFVALLSDILRYSMDSTLYEAIL